MKFRSYVIIALAATACVPFIAWTVLQFGDIDRRIAEADQEQRAATQDAASLIAERLSGVNAVIELSDRTLTQSAKQSPNNLEQLLKDIVESHPFIRNLHLDQTTELGTHVVAFFPAISVDGELRKGQNHDNRWHAKLINQPAPYDIRYSPVILSSEHQPEPIMTFGRKMAGLPNHVLSGALACLPVFEDIRKNLATRGLTFVLLDEKRQYVWPVSSGRITQWVAPLIDGQVVDTASGESFLTTQPLGEGLPQWTVAVTRPEADRLMLKTLLEFRLIFLAIGVIILTSVAGWLACRPLREALKKLRADLDEEAYGFDHNTIDHGPQELREVQSAYRNLRRKLDAKQASLQEINVHLEKSVEKRNHELAAQEWLFRKVFDDIEDGIMLVTSSWEIHHENPSSKMLLTPEERIKLLILCRQALEGQQHEAVIFETTASDHRKVYECRTFPFTSRRPPLTEGFCIIYRDVTGREEIERMKNDLISIVAHELKTPVTACRLQLDLIKQKEGDRPELQALAIDLDHLNHLISDWLSVAKIDGRTFAVHPKIVQIGPLIRKAVRLVKSRHAFDFHMSVDEEVECLNVDPNALVELLVNLLTNACRYSKPNTTPNVRLSVCVEDRHAMIRVIDHGIGFPKSEAERIFDRFHQIIQGNKRRTGGTGLGLVICRAICEAHGGTIKGQSMNGQTTFTVKLPLQTSSL